MITLENLYSEHKRCLREVVMEEYYAGTILNAQVVFERKYGKDIEWTPEIFCSFWNKVWEKLPDSSAIRRAPFHLICDLAEGSYMGYDKV